MSIMALPMVHGSIIVWVIGASQEVSRQALIPLRILSFMAIPVSLRAFYFGWASFHKRTALVLPSACVKLLSLPAGLYCLHFYMGMQGAALGALSLLVSCVADAFTFACVCIHGELHTEWVGK